MPATNYLETPWTYTRLNNRRWASYIAPATRVVSDYRGRTWHVAILHRQYGHLVDVYPEYIVINLHSRRHWLTPRTFRPVTEVPLAVQRRLNDCLSATRWQVEGAHVVRKDDSTVRVPLVDGLIFPYE